MEGDCWISKGVPMRLYLVRVVQAVQDLRSKDVAHQAKNGVLPNILLEMGKGPREAMSVPGSGQSWRWLPNRLSAFDPNHLGSLAEQHIESHTYQWLLKSSASH